MLPIGFTTGLAVTTGSFSSGAIVLSYIDQANSPLSASLLDELRKGGGLDAEVNDLAKAQSSFSKGQLDAYLLIPPDFSTEAMLRGDLTVGVLVAFISYLLRVFQPIRTLTMLYDNVLAAMAASTFRRRIEGSGSMIIRQQTAGTTFVVRSSHWQKSKFSGSFNGPPPRVRRPLNLSR